MYMSMISFCYVHTIDLTHTVIKDYILELFQDDI